MATDWIAWYVLVTVLGWLAYPLVHRLLPHLPDRGYTLAKPFALLVWGFLFWLLASLRILQNDLGGTLLALFLLAGLSVFSLRGGRLQELVAWLRAQNRFVLAAEAVFLISFIAWALVRAANPEIAGTEKPMEMAFINAILRAPNFPPNDPWLSGYAISYYYFGYVMIAMLTRLTGVSGGAAFNLALALWLGLTSLAAYGLVYNLAHARRSREPGERALAAGAWALLGPFFILIVSNLQGFLEMLHARGVFWHQAADGSWQSRFWQGINIQEVCLPPAAPFSWEPERVTGIWWWRASRVLQDFDLSHAARIAAGETCVVGKEIIDEFPFFAYLLGDLHPHLLAMPFALLVVGLALNLYLQPRGSFLEGLGAGEWLRRFWSRTPASLSDLALWNWVRTPDFWAAGLALGGLAFLNTWDFPIYVGLFAAVCVLVRYQKLGWGRRRLGELIETAAALGIAGIVLYFPFYTGFASQAGGLLPSLSFFTRGVYLWVMFAPLLLPILAWLVWLWVQRRAVFPWKTGLKAAVGIVGGIWILSYLFGLIAASLPGLARLALGAAGETGRFSGFAQTLLHTGERFFGLHGGASPSGVLLGSLGLRFLSPGTWLTLLGLLALVWAGLASFSPTARAKGQACAVDTGVQSGTVPDALPGSPHAFVLLLALTGCGLALIPEFFYLRDQFGWRMNTIFKFYFQVWILWGLAAAYASLVLWQVLRRGWQVAYRVAWFGLLLMALAYPFFGLKMKFSGIRTELLTLDGTAAIARHNPDEMAAIEWLRTAPYGTIAEAIGGSYSGYARIS
ncbi:MAG: DUF2298 domain-containing protein, partial [Anaerolineaceae bacterium]|nr:DUF2298 domain-containing protein [Anaerolineaceae bacterium]